MNTAELLPLLALHSKQGLSDALTKKLIFQFQTPSRVLEAEHTQLKELEWFPQHLLSQWNWSKAIEEAKVEMERMSKFNIHCAAFYENEYPGRLKQCIDGPLLLFYKGSLD